MSGFTNCIREISVRFHHTNYFNRKILMQKLFIRYQRTEKANWNTKVSQTCELQAATSTPRTGKQREEIEIIKT